MIIIGLLSSCVARKKYNQLETNNSALSARANACAENLASITAELANMKGRNESLQGEVDHLKKTKDRKSVV